MALTFTEDKRFEDLKIGEGFVYFDGVEGATFDYETLINEKRLLGWNPQNCRQIRFVFLYDRRNGKLEVTDETYELSLGMSNILNAVKFRSTFDLRILEDRHKLPAEINLAKYM